MITAKDIFVFEQEMAAELASYVYESGLDSEERQQIFDEFGTMTEERYEELLKILQERQIRPLDRVKNGELLLMSDLNKAVKQAANDPKA